MTILWLFLSVVLLIFVAMLMFMARPTFFPRGERTSVGVFGFCLATGTYFTMVRWAELNMVLAGSLTVLALAVGWFFDEILWIFFKDSGRLDHKAPDK